MQLDVGDSTVGQTQLCLQSSVNSSLLSPFFSPSDILLCVCEWFLSSCQPGTSASLPYLAAVNLVM
jgi:hypothetical protein